MHIETFKPEDMVNIQDVALDTTLRGDKTVEEWAVANYYHGPCYTGYIGREVFGVAGIRIVRKSVGHVWAAFTPEFKTHLKDCLRCLRDSLNILVDDYGFKFLRTLSNKDFPGSQNLIEHLGFNRRRLIKEINQYLYVRKTWVQVQQ